ncbi:MULTISPECIES: D-alanyl-D-alanine carboxypeptidase/D-alanyl-D-alanine endopeptidase [unclassified Gordonia (in: high G+C Gram-positive bacteria)]|uniref:D-alanyl-D-alanine carboxypeptidase/D-alanyl-D-alanine endopeptidase n=1 Tax=unclassified Gordonia (in: high G+C Gram-positive bacteria) TaxID=2657482 RepID=UPI0026117F87|nr:D-alanyl-D-alanine carboxypeptidase/D-alanyl-D-alanine-endopeptidase [Gordonia sp. (in: high G+C Gram-positive bacteria)]
MASTTKPGRRRGRTVAITVLALVLVAILATGGFFAYSWYYLRPAAVPAGTPAQPAAVTVDPSILPVSANAPEPTPQGVSAALRGGLKDPALGKLTGVVSDPLTGAILWSQQPDQPRTPASNAKILTAAAVLEELDHDARLTTKVVEGADGQVILVGGGDPTLTAQPDGGFYTDGPTIGDLVDQLKKSGVAITSVAVAPSSVQGPAMERSWSTEDIKGGDIAPIDSLMLDGARTDTADEYSPRSDTPAQDAGRALADQLGLHGQIEEVTPPSSAKVLAEVKSAPLSTRVGDMMRFSDNVLAESLGIELSAHMGGPVSIAGGADAVVKVLREKGFDVTGVVLHDSSGLSTGDRVPARLLDQLVSAAAGDSHPKLRPMLDTFPVAGGSGTLADRFPAGENPGAGWVRAKTGTLTGVSSLTGIVQTVDGRVLAFAFMSGGTSPADARPALDGLAGALRLCGCRS